MKKLLEAGLDWDWSDDDGYARCFTRLLFAMAAAAFVTLACVMFADIQHFWLRVKAEAKRSQSFDSGSAIVHVAPCSDFRFRL